MKLGLGIGEDLPIAVQQRLATHAEGAGFGSLWTNESSGRDALLLCQAWAAVTTDIEVGVGVVPIWTRTPAQLAMAAATLQEASGGRFCLGLGVGHEQTLAAWHGVEARDPLTAVAEYLEIVQQLGEGRRSSLEGEVFSSDGFELAITPRPRPTRRYLAAMGPRMLEVAGASADGVLLNWVTPEEVTRAARSVRAAAGAAGRGEQAPEVAAYVRIAIASDRDRARIALAEQIARYLGMPAYRAHLERQGFADAVARLQAAQDGGADATGMAEALGSEVIDALGWSGGATDDPGELLERYRGAGLDRLIARVVVVGDDPFESATAVVRAFDPYTPAEA